MSQRGRRRLEGVLSLLLLAIVLNSSHVLSQQSQDPITKDINRPNPVYSQTSVSLGNRLFILGGVDPDVSRRSGPVSSQVATFDYGGTEFVWRKYTSNFPSTSGASAIPIGSRALLLFGAASYSPNAYVDSTAIAWFDPLTGQVEPMGTTPAPGSPTGPSLRYGHSAGYIPALNSIYVFGGYAEKNQQPFNRELWKLNLTSNIWVQIPPPASDNLLPPATVGTSAVVVGKYFVVCFGAVSGQGPISNTCSVFDTSLGQNGAWIASNLTTGGSVPAPRSATRMAVDGSNQVWVHGGGTFGTDDVSFADIWVFDGKALPTITWRQVTPGGDASTIPSARRDHSFVVSDADPSKFIIFGGHDLANDAPKDTRIYVLDTRAEPRTFTEWRSKIVEDESTVSFHWLNGLWIALVLLIAGGFAAWYTVKRRRRRALRRAKRRRSRHEEIKVVDETSAGAGAAHNHALGPQDGSDADETLPRSGGAPGQILLPAIKPHTTVIIQSPSSPHNHTSIPVAQLVAPHVPPMWRDHALDIPPVSKSASRSESVDPGIMATAAARTASRSLDHLERSHLRQQSFELQHRQQQQLYAARLSQADDSSNDYIPPSRLSTATMHTLPLPPSSPLPSNLPDPSTLPPPPVVDPLTEGQQPLNQFATVVFNFAPDLPDELELRTGDIIAISQTFKDGWAHGTNINTRRSGTLPMTAVKLVDATSFSPTSHLVPQVPTLPVQAVTTVDEDLSCEGLLARGIISETTYLRLKLKELEVEMEKCRRGVGSGSGSGAAATSSSLQP
ncbi:hypothetical protein DFS34DRAFT_635092 [Phlyctochytrium arcticum]|nr:hypothetical protein DFS34DRAFT_635092 [Phlyctochytrium arcticum]